MTVELVGYTLTAIYEDEQIFLSSMNLKDDPIDIKFTNMKELTAIVETKDAAEHLKKLLLEEMNLATEIIPVLKEGTT